MTWPAFTIRSSRCGPASSRFSGRSPTARSIAEIAETLKLSAKTANHQTQIKTRVGIDTTAGLVHLTLHRGLIRTLAE